LRLIGTDKLKQARLKRRADRVTGIRQFGLKDFLQEGAHLKVLLEMTEID
jgi:hypothetical protein